MNLRKRRLGRTNLMVTELGLGIMDTPQSKEGYSTIQCALESGVNFVDTAREYEGSEYLLGKVIRARGTKDFYVATKSFSRTMDGIQYEVDKSLSILGVDKVDLYQLHDVSSLESWNEVISQGGALDGLRVAKLRNLIDYIGISSHSPIVIEKAIEYGAFDTVMLEYSAFYRESAGLIAMAKEADIGIIVMRPLGGSGRTSAIRTRMSKGNTSLTPSLLLRYVFSNIDISTAIPGARFPDRIRNNVNIAVSYQPLEGSQKEDIEGHADFLF